MKIKDWLKAEIWLFWGRKCGEVICHAWKTRLWTGTSCNVTKWPTACTKRCACKFTLQFLSLFTHIYSLLSKIMSLILVLHHQPHRCRQILHRTKRSQLHRRPGFGNRPSESRPWSRWYVNTALFLCFTRRSGRSSIVTEIPSLFLRDCSFLCCFSSSLSSSTGCETKSKMNVFYYASAKYWFYCSTQNGMWLRHPKGLGFFSLYRQVMRHFHCPQTSPDLLWLSVFIFNFLSRCKPWICVSFDTWPIHCL